MALKMFSFADLLQNGGDGGVSGDMDCKANAHAGLTVPTHGDLLFPSNPFSGDRGNNQIGGGDTKFVHSCGFQGDDPTDPTVPKAIEVRPIDRQVDPLAWVKLASAYHAHHFSCTSCIAAGQGVGLRCGIGSALWRAYSLTPPPKNALNPSAPSGKEESHE